VQVWKEQISYNTISLYPVGPAFLLSDTSLVQICAQVNSKEESFPDEFERQLMNPKVKITLRALCLMITLALLGLAGWFLTVTFVDLNPQSFAEAGSVHYVSLEGLNVPTLTMIEEDFEGVPDFLHLLDPEPAPRFTQFTLQSPAAPSVSDYVALRRCIVSRSCDFVDNRIDISRQVAHNGLQSLRFHAAAPDGDYVSKSSLDTNLLHIAAGNDLWFSAYYLVDEGMPRTLADFETSAMKWGPGPRLILTGDLGGEPRLAVELKHGLKPVYRQEEGGAVTFPRGQWVHVMLHLQLSSRGNGLIQVWQDCRLIIDARGRNLPKASAVLDRMQLGITATDRETELYVDDVLLGVNQQPPEMAGICN